MRRLSVILISALLLAGCNAAPDDEPAGQSPVKSNGKTPARQAKRSAENDRADDGEPKTEIVRALLEAIDEVDGEDDDVKDELRQTLRDSDKELRKVLGGNSRRLIEQANKKPPAPMVVPATNRPAKATPTTNAAAQQQAT